MRQFRKRPITVDAVQYFAPDPETGEGGNRDDLAALGVQFETFPGDARIHLAVAKAGAVAVLSNEDWVIAEPDGVGFYPCASHLFDGLYGDTEDDSFVVDAEIVDDDTEKVELRSLVENLARQLDEKAHDLDVTTAALDTAGQLTTAEQAELEDLRTKVAQLDAPPIVLPWAYDGPRVRDPLLVSEEHRVDEDGNPAGGETIGTGLVIQWQEGPLVVDGERKDPNGAFVEAVIQAAVGRIESYQASKFACQENADALDHLYAALGRLNDRTSAREGQGVEGTHEVHES